MEKNRAFDPWAMSASIDRYHTHHIKAVTALFDLGCCLWHKPCRNIIQKININIHRRKWSSLDDHVVGWRSHKAKLQYANTSLKVIQTCLYLFAVLVLNEMYNINIIKNSWVDLHRTLVQVSMNSGVRLWDGGQNFGHSFDWLPFSLAQRQDLLSLVL